MRHFQSSGLEERRSRLARLSPTPTWGIYYRAHSSIRCFGASERVCGGPDRGGRRRRDNLVGAKTAIPFLPSFLSTSGNDSPLFPSSLSLSPSAALIADRSSPLSSGAPPESVDRTRHERSALDDAVNDGGQSGRHHFCAARASHSLRGRRGFITFR